MSKRFTQLAGTFAALAAIAVGGSAIATGAPSKSQTPAKPAVATKAPAKEGQEAKETGEQPDAAESAAESTAPEAAGAESTSEAGDTDGAAQAAACAAAGVKGDNVNYDDTTGTCSVDTGADSNN
jgi:hypothetical protein